MSKKNESYENTNTGKTEYSYSTNNQSNNFNNNAQDFTESISRSLDEAKDNIRKSLDESKNQVPKYNSIVNSYQEQSLQTAREISEECIDSQKEIIGSIQSAWGPYNETFNVFVNKWPWPSPSPDAITEAYTKFVTNVADSTVSAFRLANCIMFSNLDSMKSVLQQAKDNSKHLSNLSVNTAKTFEQNAKKITAAVQDTSKNNSISNANAADVVN
jgi:hypothetical protein